MTNSASTPAQSTASIPPDDATRRLTLANPDAPDSRHVSVAGGTYAILVSGADTGGRYCLIDMLVPPGGGPPPHRHDFEEMFTILDGEIELTLPRGGGAGECRFDREYPRQRPPRVQEQIGQAGAAALHVHAGGAGGVLHGGRRPRR
jgi:hypothetical protein